MPDGVHPSFKTPRVLTLIRGILSSLEDLVPCVLAPDRKFRGEDVVFGDFVLIDLYDMIELVGLTA